MDKPLQFRKKQSVVVDGQNITVYMTIDQTTGDCIRLEPDFEKTPAYTSQGWPYRYAADDVCSRFKAVQTDLISRCASCVWCEAGSGLIRVCRCPQLRRTTILQTEQEQTGEENDA